MRPLRELRTVATRRAVCWATLALLPFTALASNHDFNAAVASLEHAYQLHHKHIPMIGLVSFCANVASGGAVKGIQIAEFDEHSALPGSSDMPSVVKGALGASWSLIVASRSRGAADDTEQTAVFAHPHGDRMILLIAAYDQGEMTVTRVDLNAAQFAKWMQTPAGHLHPGITD